MTGEKDSPSAFQDDEFDVGILVEFEHHGGAGDRRSYRFGVDFCATSIFRHAQQHRAVSQLKVSRSFGNTEDAVRAKSRQSCVSKDEFGARLDTSAHCRTI